MATAEIGTGTAATLPLAGTEVVTLKQGSATVVTPISNLPAGLPADDSITNAKLANMAQATIKGRAAGAGTGDPTDLTPAQARAAAGLVIPLGIACSDETTALTTGTAKATFRMPFACTVQGVRATLTTAQASGSIFTVDINEAGTTILSTKLTIDNTEKTSTTAATPAVISDAALADDAEVTVDIDQIGDGTAKGLKVWLLVLPT